MWVEDDPRAIGGTKGGIRKPSGKGFYCMQVVRTDGLMELILYSKVRRLLVITMTR